MGAVEWSALAAALTAGGLIGGWVWSLAWKLSKTSAKADASDVLAARVTDLERDLASHKEHVAAEYVSRTALREVTDAINRLGDRLDGLFLHLSKQPSA